MSKIAVVFWSGTGNTAAMAQFVAQGAQNKGADVSLLPCAECEADRIADFDAVAFGCPAMGAEVLEEDEFEPLFAECEAHLKDKRIALFGSYGWGDGEWMRSWEERCTADGAILVCDSVICNDAPDEVAAASCVAMGEMLA